MYQIMGKSLNERDKILLEFVFLSLPQWRLPLSLQLLFEDIVISEAIAILGYFISDGWTRLDHLRAAKASEAEGCQQGGPRGIISANAQMIQKIRQVFHSQTDVVSLGCSL